MKLDTKALAEGFDASFRERFRVRKKQVFSLCSSAARCFAV